MGLASAFGQTRSVDNFDKVRVSGSITATLVQGNDSKVKYEILRGNESDFVTEVKNGTLIVKFKDKLMNWGNNNGKARVTITYKSLKSVDVSAGSTVKGEDVIEADDFDIDVSSGASCKLNVEAGDVSVDVSSGSTLTLDGKAGDLDVDVSSGATFNGSDMEAGYVNIDASSGSSARVWVKDHLVADATSGASITYRGNPGKTDIDSGKWSGGSVRKVGGSK